MLTVLAIQQCEIDPEYLESKAKLYSSMAQLRLSGQLSDSLRDFPEHPSNTEPAFGAGEQANAITAARLYQTSLECSLLFRHPGEIKEIPACVTANLNAGQPFGLMLHSTFQAAQTRLSPTDWREAFWQFLRYSDEVPLEGDPDFKPDSEISPQQIAWLGLGAANEGSKSTLSDAIHRLTDHLNNFAHHQVGPSQIPISCFADLFRAVLKADSKIASRIQDVMLFALARRASALAIAKQNSHLWKRVGTTFPMVDVPLISFVRAALLHNLVEREFFERLADMLSEEDLTKPLALEPFRLAQSSL